MFISDLKFCAKGDLLDKDDKLWITIFPEARKDIWKINRYENRFKVRLYLLCYGNQLGIILYKFLKWTKSKIKANITN